MQTISVVCKSCFYLSNQGRNFANPTQYRIGSYHDLHSYVYLYFALPVICPSFSILKAELIQYPIITHDTYPLPPDSSYTIYPSTKFITPFYRYTSVSYSPSLKMDYPATSLFTQPLTFDLTALVTAWHSNQLENKGLFLALNATQYMQLIAGPGFHGLEPMLSITIASYQECPMPCHYDQVSLPVTVSILDVPGQ